MSGDEREVLDHIYGAVWRMMQTRNQMAGDDPWPEGSRSAADLVVAATVGYLATASDQLSDERGREFRALLADIAQSSAVSS